MHRQAHRDRKPEGVREVTQVMLAGLQHQGDRAGRGRFRNGKGGISGKAVLAEAAQRPKLWKADWYPTLRSDIVSAHSKPCKDKAEGKPHSDGLGRLENGVLAKE